MLRRSLRGSLPLSETLALPRNYHTLCRNMREFVFSIRIWIRGKARRGGRNGVGGGHASTMSSIASASVLPLAFLSAIFCFMISLATLI